MKKRLLSMVLALSMILSLLPMAALGAEGRHPFTDVQDEDWFSPAVQYVYEKDLMKGTHDDRFSPQKTTTRGMLVTVLHRMEGEPEAGTPEFPDVEADMYYAAPVAWANANGIVKGYTNGKFGPNDDITREQLVTVLYRFAQFKGYDVSAAADLSAFTEDADQVSEYAKDAMSWAVGAELVKGKSDTRLDPKGNATRAQIATILMRFCEYAEQQKPEEPGSTTDPAPDGKQTYTVTFLLSYGDQKEHTVKVKEGDTVTAPKAPYRKGYSFIGWYDQEKGGNYVDLREPVTGDMTLYGRWIKDGSGGVQPGDAPEPPVVTYTVTFDSNGGSAVESQEVSEGQLATEPDAPTKEGYTFVGWYSDSALTTPYDFTTPVTGDITVFAKWEEENPDDQEEQIWIDGDMYATVPNESHIAFDEDNGVDFVDNELIVHGVLGTDRADMIQLFDQYQGTVVGEIADTATYQVRFLRVYSYNELQELQKELEESALVEWSSPNYVFEENTDYYPRSDAEWEYEWDEEGNPDGLNWGVEAIQAPGAWDYRDQMSYVNVGVYDTGFFRHNDLIYQDKDYTIIGEAQNGVNASNVHGTHVSGTIAAGFDNGKGITGVAPYVNLYAYDYKNDSEKLGFTMKYNIATNQLLHREKCKVLNVSLNTGRTESFAASKKNKAAQNRSLLNSLALGLYLNTLLKLDNDFIVCVAAGNTNNLTFRLDSKDPDNKFGYVWVQNGSGPLSGGVQAEYNNFLNAITIPEVKDRIIVVGACWTNNNGAYTYSEFSNIGKRVDVVAPGQQIHSTVGGNGYAIWSGTSMATPHVSGIAAMLFSVNPDLTGAEVKQIIKDTATTDVEGCSYKMVNAQSAVEEAISRKPNHPQVQINYYEVFDLNSASWDDAKAYCESLGGHLATITSQEENDHVYQIMRNAGYTSAYIGLTDEVSDGTWTWVTGENVNYTNWHSGEPNNGNATGDERYAMFYYKYEDGTWNDGDFGVSTQGRDTSFVCEWETEEAYNSYVSIKDASSAPEDAIIVNGHAYKVYDDSMTWKEAKAYCEQLGGHLATITSPEEQTSIENLVSSGTKHQYWLGATDEDSEGSWRWVTGENWGYANWDAGMPDNSYGAEHFLQMYRISNPYVAGSQAYNWNDITNDNVFPDEADFFLTEYAGFICEWD